MATYDLTSSIPSSITTGDILNCPYSGTYKTVTLPAGTYQLQCWGALGGSAYGGSTSILETGAKGGYSVGTLTLNANKTIYIYVGGKGGDHDGSAGFNGGGTGKYQSTTTSYTGGGGGGASDVRIDTDSYAYRVIVAGGGGGCANGGNSQGRLAGVGGGTSGGNVSLTYTYSSNYQLATGASQTSGGTYGYFGSGESVTSSTQNGTFGQGGSCNTSSSDAFGAGGGGWYGGAASGWGPGSGGSGYVHAGTNSASSLGQNYILTNAQTIAGDTSFSSISGGTEIGHEGNGFIRITAISVNSGLPLKLKLNDEWKETIGGYVKVSGTWKEINKVFNKVNGEWIESL